MARKGVEDDESGQKGGLVVPPAKPDRALTAYHDDELAQEMGARGWECLPREMVTDSEIIERAFARGYIVLRVYSTCVGCGKAFGPQVPMAALLAGDQAVCTECLTRVVPLAPGETRERA